MKLHLMRVLHAILLLALCGHASAALVSADYVTGSGDGWITQDSSTGLEWLDVPLTAGQSLNEVRSGTWISNGFRYATKSEVLALYRNAGTPDDGFDVSETYPAETLELVRLLGPTVIGDGRVSVMGFMGTDYFDHDLTLATHPMGSVFNAQVAYIDYLEIDPAAPWGEAHFTGGHPMSNESEFFLGSYLVRGVANSVPEPSISGLLALGVGVMVWQRRRRPLSNNT
jgi:hypothetical protein